MYFHQIFSSTSRCLLYLHHDKTPQLALLSVTALYSSFLLLCVIFCSESSTRIMFSLGGLAARERRVRKSEQLYASAEADPSQDVPPEMKGLQKIAVDFSHIPLQPANPPLTIMRNGTYVTQKETVLTFLCHDRLQSRVSISMENRSIFHIEGARWGTSWSWRRKVFDDMTGAHMFDFRHESVSLKNGWIVHNAENEKLCSLVHKRFFTKTHSGIVATIHTQAGQDVNVDMQPRDGCKPRRSSLSTYTNHPYISTPRRAKH